MSCCPSTRVPALTKSEDYKAKGAQIDLDGLDVYEVGSVESKKAILVLADIFGCHSGRHKGIADQLAAAGYYVVMPDLFHGAPIKDLKDITTFAPNWPVSKNVPDLDKVYAHLKAKGIAKTGAIGFCWGTWQIFHESKRGAPLICGVNCHPSLALEGFFGGTPEALAEGVTTPQLVCPCKGDPENVQAGGAVDKILAGKDIGKNCSFLPFPEQNHGFMTQGDISNEATARDVGKGLLAAVDFFGKFL